MCSLWCQLGLDPSDISACVVETAPDVSENGNELMSYVTQPSFLPEPRFWWKKKELLEPHLEQSFVNNPQIPCQTQKI